MVSTHWSAPGQGSSVIAAGAEVSVAVAFLGLVLKHNRSLDAFDAGQNLIVLGNTVSDPLFVPPLRGSDLCD